MRRSKFLYRENGDGINDETRVNDPSSLQSDVHSLLLLLRDRKTNLGHSDRKKTAVDRQTVLSRNLKDEHKEYRQMTVRI